MKPPIALFANADSAQIREIAAAVAAAGGQPLVADIQLGGQARNSVVFGAGLARWNDLDLSTVRAVHIRCTAPRTLPAVPALMNAAAHAELRAAFLREQEFNAATYAFFTHLEQLGALVANPLTGAYLDHNSKAQFYLKLRDWGFRVPDTLTTNDPGAARAFLDQVGEAVVKPAIGIGSTRLVQAEDLERLDELWQAPVLFQQRIPGDTVRVHIVGDTMVLALRILSDELDSRTAPKGFEYLALDPAEGVAICRANRALGLHYAAWDAIVGVDGRLTYLDCNPGPNLMWIGEDNRRAVFARLAAYLVAFARSGSVEDASGAVTPWVPA